MSSGLKNISELEGLYCGGHKDVYQYEMEFLNYLLDSAQTARTMHNAICP